MAPSLPAVRSNCETPPTAVLFEGAEKKLHITFTPPQTAIQSGVVGLRALTRKQINLITDAAKCTILSAVSNDAVDAYLLSESSLFLSETDIMLKTCGTTTLLRALPTILRLASAVGLLPILVKFSRVAYRFPEAQLYPHDSFDNEAAFLDEVLLCHGRVFRHSTTVATQWFAYVAAFEPVASVVPRPLSTMSCTLEICMFDLDPRVMRRFMFFEEPERIGSDMLVGGTTQRSGVASLLRGADSVDAFNFEPCGYSMNAVAPCGGYYTIHVTPEDDASYVSFETTVTDSIAPHVVAAVARMFKPGRLTASLLTTCRSSSDCDGNACYAATMHPFSWHAVSKLLCPDYASIGELYCDELNASGVCVTAVVASYHAQITELWTDADFGVQIPDYSIEDAIGVTVANVAQKFGAVAVGHTDANGFVDLSGIVAAQNKNGENPSVVIDLARVARNYAAVRGAVAGECVELRFSVRCCMDSGVLGVLAGLRDIVFEACDEMEIDALDRAGVASERIVLETRVITRRSARLFGRVGGVVVRGVPGEDMVSALRATGVALEVMVVDADVDAAAGMVMAVSAACGRVRSVGAESGAKRACFVRDVCSTVREYEGVEAPFAKIRYCGGGGGRERCAADLRTVCTGAGAGAVVDVSEALVEGALSVVTTVVGRRSRDSVLADGGTAQRTCDVYLNDGMYGLLGARGLREAHPQRGAGIAPRLVGGARDHRGRGGCELQRPLVQSTFWGPTCDSTDRVWDGPFARVEVGQRIVFHDVGAYVMSCKSEFNGFCRQFDTLYVASEE